MTNKPNYYAIIPAEVRYNEQLSANEKLMYGEITALTQSTGECWATNAYFGEIYNKDVRTIRRWVSHLSSLGYINIKLVYKPDSKEVDKRIITLGTKLSLASGQKCPTGEGKNVRYNNTRENTTSIIDAEFEKVWAMYERKGNKQTAMRYWKKLSKADQLAIKEKIPTYVQLREKQYRKDLQGWINPTNRMWEDEIDFKPQEQRIVLK
jgi:hypothetical protein